MEDVQETFEKLNWRPLTGCARWKVIEFARLAHGGMS